ncbi:PREDICTED: uncharacterized protein LOC108693592 [Atta colombica]|uniref:uncharacterized protein LOC108693592 n=1 Tax=Atta colombica TaxID=520822 RepID=UPI00084CDE4A|nr:PREDICTED: uncharacterized protein LOC108693592 [Atta colombica]
MRDHLRSVEYSGKTNVLISLLESPNGVRFENVYAYSNVYVYSKSLQQPNDVVPPSEARPNSIFIFDDVACDKQDGNQEERGGRESERVVRSATPRKSDDRSHDRVQPIISTSYDDHTIESLKDVFGRTDDSLATKVQNRLQTSEDRETLQAGLGPLGQKYVGAVLRGTRDKQKNGIDYVYGVYLHKDGLMFGNKRFDVDDTDNIIIDGVQYADTPGLYELIFKRIPDDLLYTENDMNK